MPDPDFIPDPELQLVAAHSADRCVQFIRNKFGRTADYSEAFVPEIENIMGLLHTSLPAAKPSEDDIQQFCMLFGSYLAETYRRNRGGEWGLANDTPAFSFGGGYKSFPWTRVYKRLLNGEEDNVHHWYMGMVEHASGLHSSSPAPSAMPPPLPQTPPPPNLPEKKGFFSRLFGG